jgi:hypothetical protein
MASKRHIIAGWYGGMEMSAASSLSIKAKRDPVVPALKMDDPLSACGVTRLMFKRAQHGGGCKFTTPPERSMIA